MRLYIESKCYNIFGMYRPLDRQAVTFNSICFSMLYAEYEYKHSSLVLDDLNADMSAGNPPERTNTYINEFRALDFIPFSSYCSYSRC